MPESLRVVYAAGLGNAIQTYHYWAEGKDDPTQVALTYSGQFYDVCDRLNASGYLIASCEEKGWLEQGQIRVEHRPIPFRWNLGLPYHIGLVWYGLGVVVSALRYRADVVIVVEGSTYPFVMALLPKFGIRVVPLLQCVLWRKLSRDRIRRWVWKWSRQFFRKDCYASVVVSDEIGQQIREIAGHSPRPIFRIFPVYRREVFANIAEPDPSQVPFRVLYAGRIEEEKGVFEFLEVAKRLAAEGRRDFAFDVCGNGSKLEQLQQAVAAANFGDEFHFQCHGHCDKSKMSQMFAQCHTVIVPTKSAFVEGFNKVVVEGVLSGRPVIASSVCTDLNYLEKGVIEVPPDDVETYYNALVRLKDDRSFYEQKHQGCKELQEEFYDPSRGWGAVLELILQSIIENRDISDELRNGCWASQMKLNLV